MPYDTPTTTQSGTSWTLSARYGNTAVSLIASFNVEDGATEADGDAALQELVDALTARPRFSGINGQKTYGSDETLRMLASS